jgi:hypothetical protein
MLLLILVTQASLQTSLARGEEHGEPGLTPPKRCVPGAAPCMLPSAPAILITSRLVNRVTFTQPRALGPIIAS